MANKYIASVYNKVDPPHAGEYGNYSVAHAQISDVTSMPVNQGGYTAPGGIVQNGDTIDLFYIPASCKVVNGYIYNSSAWGSNAPTLSIGWKWADGSADTGISGYLSQSATFFLPAINMNTNYGQANGGRYNFSFSPTVFNYPNTFAIANANGVPLNQLLGQVGSIDKDIILYATVGNAAPNAAGPLRLDAVVEYLYLGTR